MPDPIYTRDNCTPAYQLRWSLTLFSTVDIPPPNTWHNQLADAVERDGVRLLELQYKPPNSHLFLLSTKPAVRPRDIVKSVKGRLQHELQATIPKAFRRHFSLGSVGNVRREVIERYVADQLGHHRMADDRVQDLLAEFQLTFPGVDLSTPQRSTHGQYVHNLHLAMVHYDRWCEVRRDRLETTRDMVLRVARAKGHRLSRVSLYADHLHVTLGCGYEESPEAVALGYVNNLAYAHGMTELFSRGYYVGTFGEYDMGVIWRDRP
jgi:REP element-mobilizing transposase RayT